MEFIKNREALLSVGEKALRRVALDIAEAGIATAHPGLATKRLVSIKGDTLTISGRSYDLSKKPQIFIVGAGKATYPIAEALEELLGNRITDGLVSCKYGQEGSLNRIRLHLASHPLPDRASQTAAEEISAIVAKARPGDIVIACFTGGSSALFAHPVEGISIEEKAATSQVLLTCGANIIEINDVRKHLSTVKGGRLVRNLPRGAHLISLTVSDVIGDAMDYITDPSVPDRSRFADAQRVLDKYDLWKSLPKSVCRHIKEAPSDCETVLEKDFAHIDRHDVLLFSTDAACKGAAEAARAAGYTPMLLSSLFEGESSVLGRNFVAIARQILMDGQPIKAPCVLLGGGETTVTTGGSQGKGGPNQEFAAAAALELADLPGVVVVGIDSDGTDGPTDYAGGVADSRTAAEAKQRGVDLFTALRRHDITPALVNIDHAILTGNTGTNVNDLKIMVIGKPS